MKTCIAFGLFFLLSTPSGAQEFSLARPADSLSLRDFVFPRPGIDLMRPVISMPLDFTDSAVVNNLPPGFLRISMMLQPLDPEKVGPLSSLHHQTYRRDWWGVFYTALGAVEVGADAYFTYRALKKYGYIR